MTRRLAPLLITFLATSGASARQAAPTGQDVVRRIGLLPPGPGNPRNSEGAFLELTGGRLLFIYTHFTGGSADHAASHLASRFSDDGGKSWRKSRTELRPPPASRSGLQEPGVVELKDGRLLMLCRTDQGSQFRSYSADGGDTWSEARPTDLKSPLSPASVKRIPQTGDLLLVWNDHRGVAEKYKGKRTPFNLAISRDEGETWEDVKVLEDNPDGWYCYTAIAFDGDRVLLGHCAGDRQVGRLNRTQITSFPVAWLYR